MIVLNYNAFKKCNESIFVSVLYLYSYVTKISMSTAHLLYCQFERNYHREKDETDLFVLKLVTF